MEKDKEVAQLKAEFERRLAEGWDRSKRTKEDFQRDLDTLRKQLELQATENAKLKVQVIDYTKTIENLQRKDQAIDVILGNIGELIFTNRF